MKMSRQDLREEMKQTDGNPATKGRIRRIQRQMRRRKMLQDTEASQCRDHQPDALRRRPEIRNEMDAPVVVAKGQNLLAQEIKEVARWHGITGAGKSSAGAGALPHRRGGTGHSGGALCGRWLRFWHSCSARRRRRKRQREARSSSGDE